MVDLAPCGSKLFPCIVDPSSDGLWWVCRKTNRTLQKSSPLCKMAENLPSVSRPLKLLSYIWRGGSNEYPQSMFLSRNKKNNVYPCKPQFYYIKVGFKGVKLYRCGFVMVNNTIKKFSSNVS